MQAVKVVSAICLGIFLARISVSMSSMLLILPSSIPFDSYFSSGLGEGNCCCVLKDSHLDWILHAFVILGWKLGFRGGLKLIFEGLGLCPTKNWCQNIAAVKRAKSNIKMIFLSILSVGDIVVLI